MRRIMVAVFMGLALGCVAASVEQAAAAEVPLTQKLTEDMTLAHEHHPHGVPATYQWYGGPFESPAPPSTYTSLTAWFQWYRCAEAGLDPDDVLEAHNIESWELSSSGTWTRYQTGPLKGAAYPENFQGSPIPLNLVAISTTGSWIKTRMSNEGYNVHLYPGQRAPWDSSTIVGVVVAAEVRLWAYGGSTQCTVAGMGADWWPTYNATSGVKGGTLGRLVHVDGQWRLLTAMMGDEQAILANPPPIVTSPGAVR